MEPGRSRKRPAGEGSLLRKRLVKGFLGFRCLSFAGRINRGDIIGERLGHSDPEIQVQRVTEYEAEISTNRRAIANSANQLVDEKSVGSWVVAVRFSWFPEWFLPGELIGDGVMIQDGYGAIAESRLTGLVRENMKKCRIRPFRSAHIPAIDR